MIRTMFPSAESPAPSPRPNRFQRLRGLFRGVSYIAIFSGALLVVGAVADRLLPPIVVPVIDDKLAYFADHRDEFDTLFFGSSRTYSQIFPSLFDRITAEAGLPTKSFNFGADGMFPPEDGFVAEKLFALRPKNLRRVFIEISFFRNDWVGIDPDSIRALHWHDLTRLSLCLQEEWVPSRSPKADAKPPKPFRWKDWRRQWARFQRDWSARIRDLTSGTAFERRISNSLVHIRLFLRRSLNAGRGSDLIGHLGHGTRAIPSWPIPGSDLQGTRIPPIRASIPEPPLERFDTLFAKVTAEPIPLQPLPPTAADDLRRIVALVRSVGAEPILFIAPDVQPHRRFLGDEPELPMFDFTEVARWPQLFRREERLDASHLDRKGAKQFTREFATMFVDRKRAALVP